MRPIGSPQALERRRQRAVALLERGHRPSEVARMVGVTPGAVSQWKKAYHNRGDEGLAAKPHPGPSPKLSSRQREQLGRWLRKGPCWHGYPTELWTLARVAEVIRRRFGVHYDPSSVWHLLRRMGWSCQKPERRARERDEGVIVRWQTQDWPRIKKRPTKRR
jgi:transposase